MHNGGSLCERCLHDELHDEVMKLYERRELSLCEGLCGRWVLDLRDRGQTTLVCSASCRRRALNELRRMERRAKRPMLPPIQCVECDTDLHVARSDMKYCSSRCRVRAHRRRGRAEGPSA
jgi:hypothetical protein